MNAGTDDGNKLTRRRWIKLTLLGALGPAGICGLIQEALAKGDLPTVVGINSLSGSATVNGVNPAIKWPPAATVRPWS